MKAGLRFERFFARRCDVVITVSESIANGLKDVLKLNEKPTVILNVPLRNSTAKSEAVLRQKLGLSVTDFVFLYQGGLQKDRGVELLIDVMRDVNQSNIKLVILGNGVLKHTLQERARELTRTGKIIFHDSVPQNELHLWTMGADVGIHPMVGSCFNHLYALPNKLFEYVQCGLCVIVSNLPEMGAFVNKYQIGLTFQDGNRDSLLSAMLQLANDPVLRTTITENTSVAASKHNWEVEVEKLKELYNRILKF